MATCNFCSKTIPPQDGFIIFKKDGTAIHYCSRKCRRNTEMKRKPGKLKWTKKAA